MNTFMTPNIQSERIKGNFLHMVFFWLKNPDDQKDRQSFENVLQEFIYTNPQVVSFHIGQPAATNRPVVDFSYTYSLVVSFPDLKTHDAYQADPSHLLFIEKAQNLWNKVQIYDSVSE